MAPNTNAIRIIQRRLVFNQRELINPISASRNITIGISKTIPSQKIIPTVIETIEAAVIWGSARLLWNRSMNSNSRGIRNS